MDCDGYPEEDDIIYLRNELSSFDFMRGAGVIISFIKSTGYGRAWFENGNELNIATGGWSGCEEIMSEVTKSNWNMAHWESVHRGGLYVFKNNLKGS